MFKFFEFISELVGWLLIAASPTIFGLLIGAWIYFPAPSTSRMVLGGGVAVAGLALGAIWATKKWRGKGTVAFLSRTMRTPELDEPADERRP